MSGCLIVLEGIDGSGKTTQARKLVERLNKDGSDDGLPAAVFMCFPDRTTPTGKLLDAYLKDTTVKMDPHVSHLLFSANRWEKQADMKSALDKGQVVVCDRYFPSGAVYSICQGLDATWVDSPDRGLIQPDLVVFLNVTPHVTSKRLEETKEKERFDDKTIQTKLSTTFGEYLDHHSEEFGALTSIHDATLSIDIIHELLVTQVHSVRKSKTRTGKVNLF